MVDMSEPDLKAKIDNGTLSFSEYKNLWNEGKLKVFIDKQYAVQFVAKGLYEHKLSGNLFVLFFALLAISLPVFFFNVIAAVSIIFIAFIIKRYARISLITGLREYSFQSEARYLVLLKNKVLWYSL